MINYCRKVKVPLPRDGKKSLLVSGDKLVLVVNVQRSRPSCSAPVPRSTEAPAFGPLRAGHPCPTVRQQYELLPIRRAIRATRPSA